MSHSMMDVDATTSSQPEASDGYTILRIKRKRTDEPLDALVIAAKERRKKSKGGLDVFRFAETVEESAFEDEERKKDLHARISVLARDSQKRSEPRASSSSPIVSSPRLPLPPPAAASRQYQIVQRELDSSTNARGSPKLGGPQSAEPTGDFRMFDAVPMEESKMSSTLAEDSEVANFQSLLDDYLKINDIDHVSEDASAIEPPNSLHPPTPQRTPVIHPNDPMSPRATPLKDPVPIPVPAPPLPSDDPEYVWDVFYHRAGIMDDYEEIPNANVGLLTGLPASFDDPYSSDDESEPEDEADEDSNAEEYYKNDYPDEESDESEYDSGDMFHEHSEQDDDW